MNDNNELLTSKDIIEKVFSDDVESEALEYLSKEINKELKRPVSEIDLDRVCNLMYEKIQVMDWKDE